MRTRPPAAPVRSFDFVAPPPYYHPPTVEPFPLFLILRHYFSHHLPYDSCWTPPFLPPLRPGGGRLFVLLLTNINSQYLLATYTLALPSPAPTLNLCYPFPACVSLRRATTVFPSPVRPFPSCASLWLGRLTPPPCARFHRDWHPYFFHPKISPLDYKPPDLNPKTHSTLRS